MPIPALTPDGWLPVGEHECTIEEIGTRFAADGSSGQRRAVYSALRRYLDQPLVRRHGDHVYVDGSFTSAKEEPGDADVLLGISPPHFRPLVFNQPGRSPEQVLSDLQGGRSMRAGKRLIHAFPYPIGSPQYDEVHRYFQQSDRVNEPREKGVLRVALR